jgi:ABC-type glycerol-3-phosphate transport system substrate-binding protein
MTSRTKKLARDRRPKVLALTALAAGALVVANTAPALASQARPNAHLIAMDTVSKSNPLLLWVDPPRIPAVKAFEKAYPNIPVSYSTLNSSASNAGLEEKFVLFNRVGSGWPDAIFWPGNSAMAWATSPQINYAANLTNIISKKVQAGYNPVVAAQCMLNGGLYCLRNDDAPDVLWYNATLMKEWGYTVPKTWPQYEALGIEIGKQHPGYYVGELGDTYAVERYLWGSGCPTNDLTGPNKVYINLSAPTCTRAENMIDALQTAKVMSPAGIFDSAGAIAGAKLVMSPGAAWWGVYLFEDTFKVPKGEITATNPLQWPGSPAGTGDEGGGLWSMSSHISGQRQADTALFLQYMATGTAWQVDLSTGLPAYAPDQNAWITKNIVQSGYFADPMQIGPAMKYAGTIVRPNHGYLLYDEGALWTQVITPVVAEGKLISSAWSAYQSALVDNAKVNGYSVTT